MATCSGHDRSMNGKTEMPSDGSDPSLMTLRSLLRIGEVGLVGGLWSSKQLWYESYIGLGSFKTSR
jgi:hypothetical protein